VTGSTTHENSTRLGGSLPGGRSLFGITFVHAVAEFSAWITVLVVAFDSGGAAATGLAVAVQLIPAALLAPIVTAAGDRFPRHLVLVTAFAALATSAAGLAVVLAADASLIAVYVLAAAFTVALCSTPGTVASLLVHHARSPVELMHWNVAQSLARATGSLLGPLLTAVTLAVAAPSAVFVGLSVLCAAAAGTIAFRLPPDDRLPSSLRLRTILDDSVEGLRYVASTTGPRRTIIFIAGTEVLMGVLDVVFVAVAFDQLGLGGSATALIATAFAVGALVGSVSASRRIRWKLTTFITGGVLLATLPLTVLGESTTIGVVMVLVGLLGGGHALVEIGSHTLLQRTSSERMTSRSFGVLDSFSLAAAAAGAAVAGVVVDGNDLTVVAIATGCISAAVLLAGSLALRDTERRAQSVDTALVDQLREVSFLDRLPLPTLERLATGLERRTVDAEEPLVVQGTAGRDFFVVLDGAVEVTIDDSVVGTFVAPASFGEVALLHDEVRTATVTTTTPCELAVIGQRQFLDAVERTASGHREALAVAQRYRRPTNG
jgi:MFS family permease